MIDLIFLGEVLSPPPQGGASINIMVKLALNVRMAHRKNLGPS